MLSTTCTQQNNTINKQRILSYSTLTDSALTEEVHVTFVFLKIRRLSDSAVTEEVHDALIFFKIRRLADSAFTEEEHVVFVFLKLGRLTEDSVPFLFVGERGLFCCA